MLDKEVHHPLLEVSLSSFPMLVLMSWAAVNKAHQRAIELNLSKVAASLDSQATKIKKKMLKIFTCRRAASCHRATPDPSSMVSSKILPLATAYRGVTAML